MYTVIYLKDGRKAVADLMYDLAYIQKGLKTYSFMSTFSEEAGLDEIKPEELEEIDEKIGYKMTMSKTSVYTDYFVEMLKEEMKDEELLRDFVRQNYSEEEARNLKPDYLVKYKFDVLSRFFQLKAMGINEAKTLLSDIFAGFFNKKENEDINSYSLTTEHETPNKVGHTDMIKVYSWRKPSGGYEFYIYEKGHRKIAYIHGADSSVTRSRLTSFYKTAAELGIDVPDEYIGEAAYRDTKAAHIETERLLDLKDRPTCILYPDDFACFGGINAINERGLRIPNDISVAGYDGIRIGRHVEPTLTTVKQDTLRLGQLAAEKLLSLIEHPKTTIIEQIIVEGEVYPGGSVGAV